LGSVERFRIGAVQACPVFLDGDATISKACDLIRKAGAEGLSLAVFPEAFVPCYPLWVWFIPPGHTHPLRELYSELHANAVSIPSAETDRLCEAARAANLAVVIGVNERNSEASDSTLYNTLLYIGPDGSILGRHRKLVPTSAERLVWGMGDGSDLEVYELPFAKLGGLVCWENYMPLARYALSAWGVQIHAAPTWDHGEPWLSSMRHIAKEERCFVVSCCSPVRIEDVPDRLTFKGRYLDSAKASINPGDSVIVDPDGKIVAGPAKAGETILSAEVRREQLVGPRWQLDVAGHYGRPDVFELRVHRRGRPFITVVDKPSDGTEGDEDSADVQTRLEPHEGECND
jgi:nitrilase